GRIEHLPVARDDHSARGSKAGRERKDDQEEITPGSLPTAYEEGGLREGKGSPDVEALSDRVRVKEPESSERDVNAVEVGKEPGKDGKLVTLEQVKKCHYGRKRDDQREDEPRSTWSQCGKRTESMERGVRSETSESRKSNRVDGEPTIGIPDKCENRLDGCDKIVPVDTIELIKKKEKLGVDNGAWKNQ
ncbi:5362_t:CDS:2, partial [Acaulospora morrowiae]